ncbi:Trm112 family protein [Mailhella sp.]|uniref:Trm112 family protein n=1 Tax=Mailhella sp. TaxID=1981029 RepID=UPI004063A180
MTDAQLDILVCPNCRQDTLTVIDAQTGVVCLRCRLVYPVRDDVPILSAEAAVSADAWFTGERGLSGTAESEGRTVQPAEVCR